MKLRLLIALGLALALTATLTLTAFAEEALVIEDAPIIEDGLVIEDELVIEDALTEGEADLTLDGAIGLLPDDKAPEEGTVANGTEANGSTHVSSWYGLVDALKSAKNGDTIIVDSDIEGNKPISIDGKIVTVDLKHHQINGKTVVKSLFMIVNGGELVLKGGSDGWNTGIIYGSVAVSNGGDSRFTIETQKCTVTHNQKSPRRI